ncbi:MAG: PstS family phosphate ABC transporter substrate-binding protein [Bacteriovoracaceae bacterium]|nr:PstS family phosphate ABC transporter substrate-binding protein [Bacteriovoracaceae bacterium]
MFRILLLVTIFAACSRSNNNVVIQNKGSDTIVNLAQTWAEEYKKVAPTVAIAVSGGGSGTGLSALINGTVDIANSSRKIKDQEKADAEKNRGGSVTEHIVGLDALAVFVHPANPIKDLTIEEIACIYGKNGTCEKWSDIRGTVVPGCQDNKIIRISRQSNSGTYEYFREAILGGHQDFKTGSMDLNGSREGVDMVGKTPCGIGYTGMGYLTKDVSALCISKVKGEPCVAPTLETALNKTYPIARELFMYTVGQVKPEVTAFLEWIKTDQAKELTKKSGYVPAP